MLGGLSGSLHVVPALPNSHHGILTHEPGVVSFRSTLILVEFHPSARKHGVEEDDVLHAIEHALAIEDAGEDPDRWLVIGPDTAGNLLEVVVMTTAEGGQLVLHAMSMRTKFRRLLEP